MTKVEALQKVFEDNNGIASWNIIYNQIEKYYPTIKQSSQWESGIRGVLYREIKNKKNFKRIGLSLYALQDYQVEKVVDIQQDTVRMHSYMEGVCLEIGNFLKLDTYTADPTAKYNNISLSDLSSIKTIPNFTYNEIMDSTKRIDVLWFNSKGYQFPKRAIEIVDSIGTLETALKRTFQLIEFNLTFFILCKSEHVKKVEKELTSEPYKRIANRYIVKNYDSILNIYNNPISNMKDVFLKVQNYF
jgi:hypothetical protein